MDLVLPQRSRTYICLGRNVIRLQASHISSAQGTVLGPLLFLIYINDLPNCVNSSTIRLCADHCLIYKEIHSQHDTEYLQADLDALQTWERRWLMSFHPQKCQLLRITRKPSPIAAQYNTHGHVLEVADTA